MSVGNSWAEDSWAEDSWAIDSWADTEIVVVVPLDVLVLDCFVSAGPVVVETTVDQLAILGADL